MALHLPGRGLTLHLATDPIPVKYMMRRLRLLQTNEHRLPMLPAAPQLERRLDAVLERGAVGRRIRPGQK